jgi:hypothetical protein
MNLYFEHHLGVIIIIVFKNDVFTDIFNDFCTLYKALQNLNQKLNKVTHNLKGLHAVITILLIFMLKSYTSHVVNPFHYYNLDVFKKFFNFKKECNSRENKISFKVFLRNSK